MQTDITWAGIEYDSTELCVLSGTPDGYIADAVIAGHYQGNIYRVAYRISINSLWQTTACTIQSRINGKDAQLHFESDGKGNWHDGVHALPEFTGCTDVDIPLTPFTNTLPINRLQLAVGETRIIDVLYIDLLANEIKPLKQKYRRLSANTYQYENVPNDFEAIITVDEQGLVVDYPELFRRTAVLRT